MAKRYLHQGVGKRHELLETETAIAAFGDRNVLDMRNGTAQVVDANAIGERHQAEEGRGRKCCANEYHNQRKHVYYSQEHTIEEKRGDAPLTLNDCRKAGLDRFERFRRACGYMGIGRRRF
jgi:hypothetical protein